MPHVHDYVSRLVQILLLLEVRPLRATRLCQYAGLDYTRFKKLLPELVDMKYIEFDGKNYNIANRGRQLLGVVKTFNDVFSKDLNIYYRVDLFAELAG